MDDGELLKLLELVARGERSPAQALRAIQPDEDLGFAKLDLGRAARTGVDEAVFAESKTDEELAAIVDRMIERLGRVLVTRLAPARLAPLEAAHPQGVYRARARVWSCGEPASALEGRVSVVSAGTADLAVAEEAAETAAWCGLAVERCYDVGVAGLGRLLARIPRLRESAVVIAVAGMDGALPTVLAGLVPCPVVAVPTSVGYGVGLGGIAPLLTMLNGCAPGVAVVNVDNGYGAAVLARRVLAGRSPDAGSRKASIASP
ncbi:MAG TPA: nickel pincer cofactor biosynthesis protein LarB [Thermoanaerobaculia bacterium]|nr:nickel pincer cofactor biosynthesis protein LarB [Thermoanaerobaculia bacterium]